MVETNTKRPVLQDIAAAVLNLLTTISSLLFILKSRYQNSMLIASFLNKREPYWKKRFKQNHERRTRRKERKTWYVKGRTDKWWQNMVSGILSRESWKKNFRMSRDKFEQLVNELNPWISPDPNSPNKRAISSMKKVDICLYYLKDTGSLSMTANTFGVHTSTASKIIREVCSAITHKLGPKYVKLLQTEDEMIEKAAEFVSKYGMHQAFGCIDGTHIPILRPFEYSQDYFCYKQYFSLNVQAVCDFKGTFMDVDCRWPGSVHDAKVFANSQIGVKLRNHAMPITEQVIVPGRGKVPNYLIGDPAYPLTPYCMREFEKCTKDSEVIFNTMLRSTRNPVECAFGRLKARWSVLTKKIDLALEYLPIVIYACFVLHNYCESRKCVIDAELVKW